MLIAARAGTIRNMAAPCIVELTMSDRDELQRQADQVRASGLLGKPGALSRLFDYLLERSLAADTPKEIEIALQVFGKSTSFDVSQDSVVRVYVHKLRRRLDDFYTRSPALTRIVIPKGEYRLAVEHAVPEVAEPESLVEPAPAEIPQAPNRRWWLMAAAMLGALVVGAAIATVAMMDRRALDMRDVRGSIIWAPLLNDDLPITIVVGDYYLLGELNEDGRVQRLVREFSINSPADFMEQAEADPAMMARYRNLNLTYLPTATSFALQDIVPLLSAKKPVRMLLMSDLKGSMLKDTHIVYVGYISGLGILADSVFSASRLTPGGSYDELIDTTTHHQYLSSAADVGETHYTDYSYFSTFPGPNRNRVIIIAGTRDTGVMNMAETLSRPRSIAALVEKAGSATSFESLYEVYGVAQAGLNAKQLFVSPVKTAHIWDAEPQQ
jgi:hypothetical protein